MATIANLGTLRGFGIWADRNNRSPNLAFRRYNLIYGFNGSGKSTLSRLFASLSAGAPHPRLPEESAFEVAMDNGSTFGCPSKPSGLERHVLVFNADYVEENLQWATGLANPVFFIGSDQADAAAELGKLEARIASLTTRFEGARTNGQVTEKAFVTFKRDRAKITASHLYLGNRKYEAPSLAKDYETWMSDKAPMLSSTELDLAKEARQKAEPMPKITPLIFDAESVAKAFAFISEICGQSLTAVALEEAQRFPEMLMWLTDGHAFHAEHGLENCLLCGNAISKERMAQLASALDDKIDQFISRLSNTSSRLEGVSSLLAMLEESAPAWDAVGAAHRQNFKATRGNLVEVVRRARKHLTELKSVLAEKQKQPGIPADMSRLPTAAEIAATVEALTQALAATNAAIAEHNQAVEDFAKHKEQAELDIRKHFIAECRDDYAVHSKTLTDSKTELDKIDGDLQKSKQDAEELRRKIKAHGPAATAINSLIASYLGHKELAIHPVEQGYELHRHGKAIRGLPSEGEKTAIAIAYFLSSIEAEGRKLKNSIVVIDDPVSSLDTKALNFACALVRNRLAEAGQLFILTHNMQCMNEFKKSWKGRARRAEENGGKQPTAAFYFIDVKIPKEEHKRSASLVEMSRLLREYDSEYHYLFSQVLAFAENPDNYDDYGYMMPNVLRRVLDVFLAFRCPGSSGLSGQIGKLCSDYPELDKDRLIALERLAHVESHSDSLDDLLTFSAITLEETKAAAGALLAMMDEVDKPHLKALKRLCA